MTVLLSLALSPTVDAASGLLQGSRYTSARGVAMGDAFLPLADDGASALFYNPAGLGKIRKLSVEPMNIQFQMNSEYVSHFDTNFYKITSLSSYAPVLAKSPGAFPGVSAAYVPTFAFRDFGFGMLLENRLAATASNGLVHYRSRYSLIPTAGGALRLASGILRIGYSLQWVNQTSGDVTVPATSGPLGYDQKLSQGSALSHNLGFALSLPFAYLPSFNIVARNVGTAKYRGFSLLPVAKNSSGTPLDEPMTVDASISFQPKTGVGGGFNLVLQGRDLTNQSGISLLTRLAVGSEFTFREKLALRFGIGNGYPSLGLGLKTAKAEFSLSWFSEETGASFRSERDTRYILQYQVRAFR